MFSYEQIKELRGLELEVYHYVIEHTELVQKMTIRQLSEKTHVSTSTILRFCNKMGCEGFSEMKYKLKDQELPANQEPAYDPVLHMSSYFNKIMDENFQESIAIATNMILDAERVLFLGIGTSGSLGEYGQRYFSNIGIQAYSINDPFLPTPTRSLTGTLVIVLSVSGETHEVIKQSIALKKIGAKIFSITNAETSTLAKIADLNISYYMPDERTLRYDSAVNLTTQIPVVSLIEILAHRVYQREDR